MTAGDLKKTELTIMEMKEDTSEITYDLNLLSDSLSAWERSPGLRCVYADIYREIASSCIEGPTLEVGSGVAVSRDYFSHLVTSDIVKTPYVDCAMSAYDLEPGADGLWANIFAVDVLHHLKQPMRFFRERGFGPTPRRTSDFNGTGGDLRRTPVLFPVSPRADASASHPGSI
jgi:hypothetical protein